MRRAVWRLTILPAVLLFGAACSNEDPLDAAAQEICDAIDAEASDEAAFEGFELAVARERRAGMDEDELRAAVDERCGRAVTAITAAAAEPDEEEPEDESDSEPELQPEPEPQPEPVDLVTVDWLEQSWVTNCTSDGEVRGLRLAVEDGLGAVHRPDDGAITPVYVVDIDDVVFGDVTGSGHEEAIFATQCVFANAETFLEVWSHDDGGLPVQLPTVEHFSRSQAALDSVEVVDGRLRVHSFEGAAGDSAPHINGYPVEVVTDWSFDGREWLSDEISRSDPPEAESAGPASCANSGASPEDTTKCLIDALSEGDREAAKRAATDAIVEFFFEDGPAISPPSPGATFQGCGEPRLGMRVAGGVACFWEAPGSGEFVQFDVAQQDGAYRVAGAGYGSAWPG